MKKWEKKSPPNEPFNPWGKHEVSGSSGANFEKHWNSGSGYQIIALGAENKDLEGLAATEVRRPEAMDDEKYELGCGVCVWGGAGK